MTSLGTDRSRLQAEYDRVADSIRDGVINGRRLLIAKAPPGSGKTHLLIRVARQLIDRPAKLRVAIACQTNSQADDVCKRLVEQRCAAPVFRFASSRATRSLGLPPAVQWATTSGDLPHDNTLVVSTSAKWGLATIEEPFDVLFVDEAWQLAFKDLQLLAQVAPRFVFIGDPGQIPPVVAVSAARWETMTQAPHRPAPVVMAALPDAEVDHFALPATRRLPHDSARLVRGFYDFDFSAFAAPGERAIEVAGPQRDGTDRVLAHLGSATMAALTLPTPVAGPPLEVDQEAAATCVALVRRALDRRAQCRSAEGATLLDPKNIGIAATHRRLVTAIELALPAALRNAVRVDTPERWQGLEVDLMIVVHPLSGVVHPSEFDLETGRLCVMASRHRGGLVFVTRDHVGKTLDHTIPSARQPVGLDDGTGRGHARHVELWRQFHALGSVFAL